jgi:outer membrane immunogenic protein
MRIRIAIVTAIVCLLSQVAFAQAPPPASISLANGLNSADASSWIAGGQIGYDWQSGNFVFGLAADLSGTHLNSDMNGGVTPALGFPAWASTSAEVDWYGTVRGRLGWANGPWLLYATGGFAYGEVELKSNFSVNFPPVGAVGTLNAATSPLKTGWVVGGGVEYKLFPNLTLGVQYRYVDLGSVGLTSSGSIPLGGAGVNGYLNQSANVDAQFQVVTIGLNWQFAPVGGAAPWAGWYGGGFVGGAWGNDAGATYTSSCTGCVISDRRLKRDIVLVGRLKDGLGIYRYRYLWSDAVYVGVMAQEVALDRPDAVVRGTEGYLRVDYSKLGLQLMTQAEWDLFRARHRLTLLQSG